MKISFKTTCQFSLTTLAFGMLSMHAQASGYYLPEQSTNAIGLAAAYVANAHGADAAFYNPANLVFEDDKRASLEMDLLWVHSPEIDFVGNGGVAGNNSASEQDVIVPNFFYISPDMGNNWRFGLSTYSTGLKTDWTSGFQQIVAEKADIKTTEIAPSASYIINENLSVAAGVRVLYTDAELKTAGFNLTGDGWGFGYNLAVTVKPTEQLTLSSTYRSRISTELEGDALVTGIGTFGGSADFLLPSNFALAGAYDFGNTVLELTYNRLGWSDYDSLDIILNNGNVLASSARNWNDTNTYRIGLTHHFSPKLDLMAGIAFDETPVPDSTVSFDILDNDFTIYGIGAKYRLDDDIQLGAGLLYAAGKGNAFSHNNYGVPVSGSYERDLYVYNFSLTYSF